MIILLPNSKSTLNNISFVSNVKTEVIKKSYQLNKDSVNNYPIEEVMAAIAYHECFNLSLLERWLVMEAFYNRIVDNFNNNGNSIKEQLLAPKQFTGLWKFYPEQFKYDNTNEICVQNKQMAEHIIAGVRFSTTRRIYYWAGTCDMSTKHGKWVKKKSLTTPKYIMHLFR